MAFYTYFEKDASPQPYLILQFYYGKMNLWYLFYSCQWREEKTIEINLWHFPYLKTIFKICVWMNWKWPNSAGIVYISTYSNVNYREAENQVEHVLALKFIWKWFLFYKKLIIYNGTGQNILFINIFFKIRALKALAMHVGWYS